MNKRKLIIVEGIPGSGKTTQAVFIRELLEKKGIPNRLYCEGDLNHPADFEAIAHFTHSEYEVFLSRFSSYRQVLEQNVTVDGDDYFVSYRKLNLNAGQTQLDEMIAELAKYDVYEIPLASTYRRLVMERWRKFSISAMKTDEISIFECCFLQNPLTVLLGKHNVAVSEAIEHIHLVTASIRALHPVLIYLGQPDVRIILQRVAKERPLEWKEFLIAYFTQQGWGKARGVTGFEGVIEFYEMRSRLERKLLGQLDISKLLIENASSDWIGSQRAIAAFINTEFSVT
jgi:hypothetical protein